MGYIYIQMNNQVVETLEPAITHSASEVAKYLSKKCGLSFEQIDKKLLSGQIFQLKGQGNDIDTKLMEEILNQNDFYQKPSQKSLKDQAMRFIKGVVEGWSINIAKHQMRINQDQISNYTARLLPFGSYVLDLRSNSSDIDLICVCPNFIQRQTHFFNDLASKLLSEVEVRNLTTRPNARVPIITFSYKEIQIDVSFCQLQKETVPKDIEKVISNQLLTSIKDEQSKTSLLGRKNNLMIVQLTGKQTQSFKQTLRLIKVWAKNRGISSNAMGYLGGISWAILVAKICQIFPNHKPSKLFTEFFTVYSIWDWKGQPVRIMSNQSGVQQKSKESMMCVVTPGSEYNSTERVNVITFKVIYEEIKRANEILNTKKDYYDTCKKIDFFNYFPLFLEIDICGNNKGKDDEKEYKDFQGLVQSRVLKLIQNILRYHKKEIEENTFRVVPNPKIYKKVDPLYEFCYSIFIGLDMIPEVQINICRAVKEWCIMIDQARGANKKLNVRVFEGFKEDFIDVEIVEPKKKKEEKEDPRLARRAKKAE